jgi:TRAP-type C4-dicarboxylate transport system permease small subunit
MVHTDVPASAERVPERKPDAVERALLAISRVMLAVAAVAVMAMAGFIIVSVFLRYVVGRPLPFTEELVALLFVLLSFFTIPLSTARREHVAVNLLGDRLGPAFRRVIGLVAILVTAVFAGWFAYVAVGFVSFSREIGASSEQFGLTLWYWMAILPGVMAFVVLICIHQAWQAIKGHDMAAPDEAPGDIM